MERFELQLDKHHKELWESEAKKRHMSVAELIRSAMFHFLKESYLEVN